MALCKFMADNGRWIAWVEPIRGHPEHDHPAIAQPLVGSPAGKVITVAVTGGEGCRSRRWWQRLRGVPAAMLSTARTGPVDALQGLARPRGPTTDHGARHYRRERFWPACRGIRTGPAWVAARPRAETIGSALSARILPLPAAAPNTPQVAVMCQPLL